MTAEEVADASPHAALYSSFPLTGMPWFLQRTCSYTPVSCSLNINKGITFLSTRGYSQEDNWSFAVVLVCAITGVIAAFDKYSFFFFNPSLASKDVILH